MLTDSVLYWQESELVNGGIAIPDTERCIEAIAWKPEHSIFLKISLP